MGRKRSVRVAIGLAVVALVAAVPSGVQANHPPEGIASAETLSAGGSAGGISATTTVVRVGTAGAIECFATNGNGPPPNTIDIILNVWVLCWADSGGGGGVSSVPVPGTPKVSASGGAGILFPGQLSVCVLAFGIHEDGYLTSTGTRCEVEHA